MHKLVLLSSCMDLKQNSESYYFTLMLLMMMMMMMMMMVVVLKMMMMMMVIIIIIIIITIGEVCLGGWLCQMSVAHGILNKNNRR